MTATTTDLDARRAQAEELLAKLEELANCLDRAVGIADELRWDGDGFEHERIGLDDSDARFPFAIAFDCLSRFSKATEEAAWELLVTAGWSLGCTANTTLVPECAEVLRTMVEIARRYELEDTTDRGPAYLIVSGPDEPSEDSAGGVA